MENIDGEIIAWLELAKGGPESLPQSGKMTMRDYGAKKLRETADRKAADGEKKGSGSVGDKLGHEFHGNQYTKSVDEVEKGEGPGHEFHGNQYAQGTGGGSVGSTSTLSYGDRNFPESSLSNVTAKDYAADWNQVPMTDNAAKVMECVNRYMEDNPDVQDQMRNGMDAIPQWLVQSATNDDLNALTDNNYHTAVDAITIQRPDLVQKSVGEIQKDNYPVNYPNKLVADNLKTGGAPLKASEALMDTARAITMRHEAAALGQTKPLMKDDYLELAKQHEELAAKHQDLARQLKDSNPIAHLQAISAHGDAMGAHENAAYGMKAMAQMDHHWDGHHGELRPSYFENANKAWGDSHRAFLVAQMAHDRTAFDTAVAKSLNGEIMGWIGFAKGMDESLADVIRHDQDHDDWHAMHGDKPCTSEADCAAKRAKYAEVKAEEAAGVQKGDLPGHAFRGNQWTSLGAKAEKLNDAVKLLSTRNTSMATRSTPEEIRSLARVHLGIAMQHIAVVEQHDELPYLTDASEVGAEAHQALMDSSYEAQGVHDEAANAHQEASAALIHVADLMESGAAEPAIKEAMYEAKIASADALAASREGDKTSLPHPVGDSEFSDHDYKLMVSDRQDEQLGKSTEITKGDLPGHEFHGNQWSTMPAGHGARDFDTDQAVAQIGKMNILAISGGRVGILSDGGKPKGLELPVSSGYKVRVFLHDNDTYTVQRVLVRAGKETVKGEVRDVHSDDLGEQAYQAGMYKSNPFGGHNP